MDPVSCVNLIMFFEASDRDALLSQCTAIAERWGWTHDEMMALPTEVRMAYLDEVMRMYERERDEAKRIKSESGKKGSRR